MSGSWTVGRLFGIPLKIHASWLILFGLVTWSLAEGYFPTQFPGLPPWAYWTKGLVAASMLFVSIVLHELGHALVARRHGVEIAGITLFVFGGVSQMKDEPREAKAEFRIAAIGPAISLALALLFFSLGRAVAQLADMTPVATAVAGLLGYLAVINLMLALFNLVPAYPLDGGRMLRSILWHRRGDLSWATRVAVRAGKVFAYLFMGSGLLQLLAGNFGGLWLGLIGWFLLQAGAASAMNVSLREGLAGLHVRDVMVRQVVTVDAGATLTELLEHHVIAHTYGGYPVIRDGRVVGLVSLRDLKKVDASEYQRTSVETVMTPLDAGLRAEPDEQVFAVLQRMLETGAGRLMTIDEGKLTGLITRTGILHLAQVRRSLGG